MILLVGGYNYIASTEIRNKTLKEVNGKDIKYKFLLTNFMESFAVADNKVSHYVDHIQTKTENQLAERAMILIDFSFTRQVL